MKKKILLIIIINILSSCSLSNQNHYKENWIRNTNGFNILIGQFAHNVENIWGFDEILIAGPKDYIKYTDAYQTRSHIDFSKGTITIETIISNEPISHLRKAIIKTLLMNNNSETIDLNSEDRIAFSKESLLYGQIIDQTGHPLCLESRVEKFADYLLKNYLKKYTNSPKVSVTIDLVPNHLDKRINKYIDIVHQASQKYCIEESLILAIIQIESSFNPYAISRSDALGLMQIVQHSAGKDVFRAQKKTGTPSRSYLLDPANNIDIGTAYLAMLDNVYLNGIENPKSRRYAIIAAYNSGVDSVLRVFSKDKAKAENIINNMSPREVYTTLVNHHPSIELRHYLYKVNNAQKKYKYDI